MSGVDRLRARLRLPEGVRRIHVIAALATLLLVVAVVPPLRTAAGTGISRVIFFVASPFAPDISGFDELPEASVVMSSDGVELARLGEEHRERVPLDQIPEHVRHAALAAEDTGFYEHSGVSPTAIIRAALNNVTGGRLQGGSTITQQLAKINYTGNERTFLRKFREVLYAARLERSYTKDQLLERYLNQVYFGQGAYGIQIAAQTFFGVGVGELTPGQAAVLAGKIRSPERLNPRTDPEAVQKRRNDVLTAMAEHGWVDESSADAAKQSPLGVIDSGPVVDGGAVAPDFVRFVRREATTLDAIGGDPESRDQILTVRGGYRIETTLHVGMQNAAADAVREHLSEEGDPSAAVVSVVPGDGAIRALLSGLDPAQEFDLATQGRRQPGSAFKPFVYMAMIEVGIDPRSMFESTSPMELDCNGEPWPVSNYSGEGAGAPITVDEGLVSSVNVVYAQLIREVGPRAVQESVVDAGIAEDAVTPAECAMALGGLEQGVSPLEMAGAYATFAARGRYATPYSITRVTDRAGQVVYERPEAEPEQRFDPRHVGVMNMPMQEVVSRGTGRAAAIGRPLGGKTGTTNQYTNAWFIGYVPQLSTAVWVGHPEGDVPMTDVHGRSVSGGSFPASIFGTYMRAALHGVPSREIPVTNPDELGLRIVGATPTPSPTPTPTPSPTPAPPTPAPTPRPTPRMTHQPASRTPTPRPTATPREQSNSGPAKTTPTPSPTPA